MKISFSRFFSCKILLIEMESLPFTKMHGLGNDFILVEHENIRNKPLDYSHLALKMCDRRRGIGGDGLIIVNPPEKKFDADTSWRIFNSDGSEPEMCGNGIRCFARFVLEKGIIRKKQFTISTLAGLICPEIHENGTVSVDMGVPVYDESSISLYSNTNKIFCDDKKFQFTSINMGNPHCVIFIDDDGSDLVIKYGSEIEKNKIFPEKTNVEFVKVYSKNHLQVDVWERGCGKTLACGTGACAAVVAAILKKLTENSVTVDLPGGSLSIKWNGGKHDSVIMTGSASFVFDGNYFLH